MCWRIFQITENNDKCTVKYSKKIKYSNNRQIFQKIENSRKCAKNFTEILIFSKIVLTSLSENRKLQILHCQLFQKIININNCVDKFSKKKKKKIKKKKKKKN